MRHGCLGAARHGALAAPVTPTRPPLDDDAVTAAAKLLGAAQRPLIVVGGGAQDASAEITALAEMLEAPVAAFRRGHGILSARHRLQRQFADLASAVEDGGRGARDRHAAALASRPIGVSTRDLNIVRIETDPETPDRFAKRGCRHGR